VKRRCANWNSVVHRSGIDDEAAEEADEPSVQQLMREKGTSFPMKGTPKKKGKAR
jgi:hypothetical protein